MDVCSRRWVYRGVVEAIRRGQGQVTLHRLAGDVPQFTVQATLGRDIHTIRVLGKKLSITQISLKFS